MRFTSLALCAVLLSSGASLASPGSEVFHVAAGELLEVSFLDVGNRVLVVEGTIQAVTTNLVVSAASVHVRDGGAILGLDGHPDEGGHGGSIVLLGSLKVDRAGLVAAGSGGRGRDHSSDVAAFGGDGGTGGDIIVIGKADGVERLFAGRGGDGGLAIAPAGAVGGNGGASGFVVINGAVVLHSGFSPAPESSVRPTRMMTGIECVNQGQPGDAGLYDGGDGGPACAYQTAERGADGADGSWGVFECHPGGPGGTGGSATTGAVRGGEGGLGGRNGGSGGKATNYARGGDGGDGGNGGHKLGKNCPGGNGGMGGHATTGATSGGRGGDGLCGVGGAGGSANGTALAGLGGKGGAGQPPGEPGAPGTATAGVTHAGSGGSGPGSCPNANREIAVIWKMVADITPPGLDEPPIGDLPPISGCIFGAPIQTPGDMPVQFLSQHAYVYDCDKRKD